MYIYIYTYYIYIYNKNTPPEKRTRWKSSVNKHRIGDWIAASAAVSQGNGSRRGSVVFPQTPVSML